MQFFDGLLAKNSLFDPGYTFFIKPYPGEHMTIKVEFTEEDVAQLSYQRFHHPSPFKVVLKSRPGAKGRKMV